MGTWLRISFSKVKRMLDDKIWIFISKKVDNHNYLPSEDEIYIEFVYYFEGLGYNADIIGETVRSYCGVSELTGVDIKWEGELNGISNRGVIQK